MNELLTKLCTTFGPSGREHLIIDFIKKEVKEYSDSMEVDALGSLIVKKNGKSSDKRLMFAAHADEIGIAVTFIDTRGYIQFSTVGGVNLKNKLGGSRVIFESGVVGIIQQRDVFKKRNVEIQELFIDIGSKNREETLSKVRVGDFAVFDGSSLSQGDYFISKALDDRVGCLVLIETLKQLKKPEFDTYFVFSSQEEVGTRGAQGAAYAIEPDFALAVDVTLCGDTPEDFQVNMELGKGVAIKSRDRNIIVPTAVINHLTSLADKKKIPWHMEVLPFGGTDAGAIQLTKGGVPAGTLSIPCRYVHSPSEMVDMNDVKATIALSLAVCNNKFEF